jgi:hypothetical protein
MLGSIVYSQRLFNCSCETAHISFFNSFDRFDIQFKIIDGFITPADGSSVTEDIFVHQSSIVTDGYRTLVSNKDV